ncbi:MAG: SMP-30/gluconolactonase/LRE family protein [Spirochaetales bacterium]|jgi:gluconolactonase|nr:SMP-30/gluconolactonase/LRE family protein [Spirochaetales bacterium]
MLKIEIFDKSFENLLDPNQEMRLIGEFGGFVEGPIWDEKEQDLTFSSLTNQKTWRWKEGAAPKLMRENTNIGNGMAYDAAGRIIVCEQIGFRVARMNRDMSDYQVIASEYKGKPLNSPNDVVVHSSGMIYFTDPAFGRRPTRHGRFSHTPQSQNVYFIHPENFQLTLATDQLSTPNGLCFSPDESKMYFAESSLDQITVMDVLGDGTLGSPKCLAKSVLRGPGVPDGIKVDVLGNIWMTAQGGVQVFSPDGGILGLIYTPDVSGNLCFGGGEMDTLFMGSEFELYTVRTKVKGQSLRR